MKKEHKTADIGGNTDFAKRHDLRIMHYPYTAPYLRVWDDF